MPKEIGMITFIEALFLIMANGKPSKYLPVGNG